MIEVHELTVRYPESRTDALRNMSLSIADGESVALMGANGSGKSTFARSLNGLVQATSGSVRVDAFDPATADGRAQLRRRLGIVFQNPYVQVTSLTVEREIAFGLQNIGVDAGELHARVDEELVASRLEHAKTRPPGRLAAGELQRLALAAILVTRPAHLILDEATSLLSPPSRREVLRRVQEARSTRNMSLVMITQFFQEAMAASRLIVLHAGEMVFDGPPAGAIEDRAIRTLLGGRKPVSTVVAQ